MRVKMRPNQTYAGPLGTAGPGKLTPDLPDDQARALIAGGYADDPSLPAQASAAKAAAAQPLAPALGGNNTDSAVSRETSAPAAAAPAQNAASPAAAPQPEANGSKAGAGGDGAAETATSKPAETREKATGTRQRRGIFGARPPRKEDPSTEAPAKDAPATA